jgi:hypothetical protein
MPRTTASSSSGKSASDWQSATRAVLDALDLEAEYRTLGIELPGNASPSRAGWIRCHTFSAGSAGDRTPSAGINVTGEHPHRGRYKEFTGDARNVSFFEFAATIAKRFSNYKEARKHYAKQAGVKLPRGESSEPADQIVPRDWIEHQVKAWCDKKPPIVPEAVHAAGGKLAGWPQSQQHTVIALPVYGEHLTAADPTGFVIWNKNGGPLPLWQGQGQKPKPVKMLTVSGSKSGWMGKHALDRLAEAAAGDETPAEEDPFGAPAIECVWKVEGPGDMLALYSAIPPELRDTHLVITNAGGAREKLQAGFWDCLSNLKVYVLHDADEPGQLGAVDQAALAAAVARETRIVQLPYEVTPKAGADIRDWLNEGHTYAELLTLAADAPVVESPGVGAMKPATAAANETANETPNDTTTPSTNTASAERHLLSILGLDVLGERDNREILVYSIRTRKLCTIPRISQFKYPDLLQIGGNAIKEHVSRTLEKEPGGHTFGDVVDAIAIAGGAVRLYDSQTHGDGIWPAEDGSNRLVLVNGNRASIYDPAARTFETVTRPRAAGVLLDLSPSGEWVNLDALPTLITAADSPDWRRDLLDEIEGLLAQWNWQPSRAVAQMLTGVILGTWLQACWQWRPLVALSSESRAGKSTLLEMLGRIFGPLSLSTAKPSEAGLRQAIRNRSCAVFIDELESDSHRRRVLELLRTAGSGSKIVRGTIGQHGMQFGLKHIVWIAAIESGLVAQADANRYIAVEFKPPEQRHKLSFRMPPECDLRDLGQRLLALTLWSAGVAIPLAERLRRLRMPPADARAIDCLSVPAAMMAAADEAAGALDIDSLDSRAASYLKQFLALAAAQKEAESLSDQEQLLEEILLSITSTSKGPKSVSQLLAASMDDEGIQETLERIGIIWTNGSGNTSPIITDTSRQALFLIPGSIQRHLLGDTQWRGRSIQQVLKRLEGSELARRRVGSSFIRGILVPYEVPIGEF